MIDAPKRSSRRLNTLEHTRTPKYSKNVSKPHLKRSRSVDDISIGTNIQNYPATNPIIQNFPPYRSFNIKISLGRKLTHNEVSIWEKLNHRLSIITPYTRFQPYNDRNNSPYTTQ